ncbi:hypothetical protein [Metasolibacillus meyeri]|uniref:hypothetical protein n=1 Tax=Metasolibacillus meyeri TaxID=1071052 RepID=UPI000D314429|nr:hypothetical protein [Metasolibacillus meyeri]
MNKREIEIRKEKACCKDLITAINLHTVQDDYHLVEECALKLKKSAQKIKRLEEKQKAERRERLYATVEQLRQEGKIVKIGARPSKGALNDAN